MRCGYGKQIVIRLNVQYCGAEIKKQWSYPEKMKKVPMTTKDPDTARSSFLVTCARRMHAYAQVVSTGRGGDTHTPRSRVLRKGAEKERVYVCGCVCEREMEQK